MPRTAIRLEVTYFRKGACSAVRGVKCCVRTAHVQTVDAGPCQTRARPDKTSVFAQRHANARKDGWSFASAPSQQEGAVVVGSHLARISPGRSAWLARQDMDPRPPRDGIYPEATPPVPDIPRGGEGSPCAGPRPWTLALFGWINARMGRRRLRGGGVETDLARCPSVRLPLVAIGLPVVIVAGSPSHALCAREKCRCLQSRARLGARLPLLSWGDESVAELGLIKEVATVGAPRWHRSPCRRRTLVRCWMPGTAPSLEGIVHLKTASGELDSVDCQGQKAGQGRSVPWYMRTHHVASGRTGCDGCR